ncbi:sulfotransferase, partial [cf. Phormidesmis sp. LEGE 11477]|uniref:sulfotransferase n=1 Tax=cf. Phormidesmis sp. LEGE 11477 TaxID=1828680 RepID=UPI001880AFC3
AQTYAQRDNRIRFIKAKHQGRGQALATAFSFASGKYLALLDSDDWLAPNALSATVAVLEAMPEVSMVYSDYWDVSESGAPLKRGHRCAIPYSKDRLLLDFMAFHFRLFRRQSFAAIGGIDPQFVYAADYDLSLKLSEVGEVVHLKQALYFYRQHRNSISSTQQLKQVHYSQKAVADALERRGLSAILDVEVKPQSKLVLRRKKNSQELGRQRVFGIGLGQAGTTSLCAALSLLGYRTIHVPESMGEISSYDAVAGLSVAVSFRELDWRYPDAKFILTVSPLGDWLASWQRQDANERQQKDDELSDWSRRLRIRIFGQSEFSPTVWAQTYEQHRSEVKAYFKRRPQQLLIYNLCRDDGWNPLCNFLEKPIPNAPLPHHSD